MKKMEYSDYTQNYLDSCDINYRKKYGQFFTPNSLINLSLSLIDRKDSHNYSILEPSGGTGDFVKLIKDRFINSTIDIFEIDNKLCKILQNRFNQENNINIFNKDFLLTDFQDKKYDLIIGNLPYFETLNKEYKKKYYEIISGRVNIYSYFIKQSIDLLKVGGLISFIVPTSMLSGSYFKKLRRYIVDNCSIKKIITDYKDDYFEGAKQNVMILVLQKEKNDGKYIFKYNNLMIFSEKYDELYQGFKNCKSLKELGFIIKTGSIVWNQHKSQLSSSNEDTLLVWAHNIKDGKLVLNDKKPQYIKNIVNKEYNPIIVVNRIVGLGEKSSLRFCLIENKNGVVCENHVNMIKETKNSKISIKELFQYIQNEKSISLIKEITGNTQISKTELECLFPVFI